MIEKQFYSRFQAFVFRKQHYLENQGSRNGIPLALGKMVTSGLKLIASEISSPYLKLNYGRLFPFDKWIF